VINPKLYYFLAACILATVPSNDEGTKVLKNCCRCIGIGGEGAQITVSKFQTATEEIKELMKGITAEALTPWWRRRLCRAGRTAE